MPEGNVADERDRFDDWLINEGSRQDSLPTLVDSFCRFLNREGYAIRRCNLASETVHPMMANTRHVWFDKACDPGPINPDVLVARRQYAIGEALIDEVYFNSGSQQNPQFLASPFHQIELRGEICEPIPPPGEPQPYPLFGDLAALGCTAYFGTKLHSFPGMLQKIGLATSRPGGFADEQTASLRRYLQLVTLHVDTLIEHEVKQTLARVYVGQDPGGRVCAGMIRVGEVVSMDAAIWFSDIRGYTSISEGLAADQLLESLNAYFDVVVSAIYESGGEVLKYIGDAVLAVFPVEQLGSRGSACVAALNAATNCAQSLAVLNRERTVTGEPEFAHGIGLHVGEVRYGNIGSRERLDFTVIGPEVNIASRIEGVCKQLSEPLICSSVFAAEAGIDARGLGPFNLKGVAEPVPLCVPL